MGWDGIKRKRDLAASEVTSRIQREQFFRAAQFADLFNHMPVHCRRCSEPGFRLVPLDCPDTSCPVRPQHGLQESGRLPRFLSCNDNITFTVPEDVGMTALDGCCGLVPDPTNTFSRAQTVLHSAIARGSVYNRTSVATSGASLCCDRTVTPANRLASIVFPEPNRSKLGSRPTARASVAGPNLIHSSLVFRHLTPVNYHHASPRNDRTRHPHLKGTPQQQHAIITMHGPC